MGTTLNKTHIQTQTHILRTGAAAIYCNGVNGRKVEKNTTKLLYGNDK